MSNDYQKENIVETYYTISILDDCGNEYDEIGKKSCQQSLVDACKKVIEMTKQDKILGEEYGVWFYLVVKHEEDNDTDWQTFYKVFKYRGKWRYKETDLDDFCSSVFKKTCRKCGY